MPRVAARRAYFIPIHQEEAHFPMSTRTWSTCATCAGLVLVTEGWSQVNHPTCKRDTRSQLAIDLIDAVERGDDAEADRLEATLASLDRDDRNRSLPNTALWYGRMGWPVFPLRPGDKRPLTNHGFQDATTDREQIRRWWRATPAANIGIATGVMFDVIDVDWLTKSGDPSGAVEVWPELEESGVLPDIHGVALTARAGLHIFIAPQGGGNLAGRWGGLDFAGLDYRGVGGYIVAAPSRLAGGGRWSWAVRPSPRITGRPDWPDDEGAAADQPTPRPEDQMFPIDPDTGREMNRWRVSGQHIDERWDPVHWWQRPYRPRQDRWVP